MIMILPRYFVSLSMLAFASLERKIRIPMIPAIKVPTVVGIPNNTLSPRAPPPTFPMLNARPPSATMNAIKYPSPGRTLFAISCPRMPDTPITDQIFNCVVTSNRIVQTITSAKMLLY